MNGLFLFIADLVSLPVWVVILLRRKKTFRRIVFLAVLGGPALCGLMALLLGPESLAALATVALYALQMIMGFAYMIVQFVGLFWYMARTKAQESYPGQEGALTFDDYWGQPHLKAAVKQWSELLTKRDDYDAMGGRPINGILLTGPPGTGKTYLARALAGSSNVPFYGMDGSSFRAMFWGVDVLKVRGFFSRLRKDARVWGGAIGFLDEIDAIGRSRSGQGGQMAMGGGMMGMAGMGALNRLLYELDGLDELSARDEARNRVRAFFELPLVDPGRILVIGSTNVPEVLDPALVRSGRFSVKLQVDKPDKASRREVIEGYLKTIAHEENLDLEGLVADTNGRTPADLMVAITQYAPRRALFDGRTLVSQLDIEMGLQEQLMGLENPISDLEPRQQHQIAVHEAGHAVALHTLKPQKRIVCLTIVRRDRALGYMMPVDEVDIYALPLADVWKDVYVSLAGDVATEVVLGERWTGAAGDIENIKGRLWYLHRHGYFGSFPLTDMPGPEDQKLMDGQIKGIQESLRRLLTENKATVERLAGALVDKKTLTYSEVKTILQEGDGEAVSEADLTATLRALDGGDPGWGPALAGADEQAGPNPSGARGGLCQRQAGTRCVP